MKRPIEINPYIAPMSENIPYYSERHPTLVKIAEYTIATLGLSALLGLQSYLEDPERFRQCAYEMMKYLF